MTDSNINAYLDNKGIRHSAVGRSYLMEAIRHRIDNPGFFKITAMYADIAERNGVSPGGVERCIRHAVMLSGDETNNKEYICRAADDLRYGKAATNDATSEAAK